MHPFLGNVEPVSTIPPSLYPGLSARYLNQHPSCPSQHLLINPIKPRLHQFWVSRKSFQPRRGSDPQRRILHEALVRHLFRRGTSTLTVKIYGFLQRGLWNIAFGWCVVDRPAQGPRISIGFIWWRIIELMMGYDREMIFPLFVSAH